MTLLLQYADKIILALVLILAFFAIRGVMNKMSERMPALPQGAVVAALGPGSQQMMVNAGYQGGAIAQGAQQTGQLTQGAYDNSTTGGSMSPMGNSAAVIAQDTGPKVVFKTHSDGPQLIEIDDGGPSVEALRAQEMLNRTVKFVMTKPDNAAQILRSWVTDGPN